MLLLRFEPFFVVTIIVSFICASSVSVLAQSTSTISPVQVAGDTAQKPQTASGEVNVDLWPQVKGPIAVDPVLEKRIDDLLEKMTLRQKVGQIIQADIGSITPEDVKTYPLGSILNGGNSAPGGDLRAPAEKWLELADAFYEASQQCDLEGGPFIPMIWGTDAVHGHNNIVGATFFPHNIGLGCARNPQLLGSIGEITALETRVTGLEWTFAPTVAIVRDDRWGRTYEGYSEAPEVTVSYVAELVKGIQGEPGGDDFLSGPHVISTAKHFCGDGGTFGGKDQGDNKMSEFDLINLQAAPYPVAVEAGVQCVMASFSSWQGKKLHGHKGLLTDVLKGRMNFDGFIVGDWEAHAQLPGCTNTDCLAALNAGLDMYMASGSWKGLFENTLKQAQNGEVDMERLNDAVRRILRVKIRTGMMEQGKPSSRPYAGQFDQLGKPEHRAVARQAVRESLVLLKNNGSCLPLSPKSTILVAGDGADDIGKQSGGWTLSWQGTGNKKSDFPGGTSIYDGIKQQTDAAGGKTVLAVDGKCDQKIDAAVVVFGEDPYAEFKGDVDTLAYSPADDRDYQLLKKFKDAGIPTVAVFISGRPMWVNRELNACDAFVAAWLPGSEGVGIADVILATADGAIQHDFVGKLSYSWPKLPNQTPLNIGSRNYEPLFEYGFGLTYSDTTELKMLSEEPGEDYIEANVDDYFFAGKTVAPWRMFLGDGVASTIVEQPKQMSANNNLELVSEDDSAQEDIKTLNFHGAASFRVSASAIDLSRQASGDMALYLRYRLNEKPVGNLSLAIEGPDGPLGYQSLTEELSNATVGQWNEVSVKLTCFCEAEKLTSVTSPLVINSSGKASISISEARLKSNEGQAKCLGK
jgi:beta-glucosidase